MTTIGRLDLRAGDWVEVRSAAEILATLDDHGTFAGLPFMPEMLAFCGRRFQVYQRADRACDTVAGKGMRHLERTVHLEGLRCDGECHGGCQAGCFLFWREAWLRRSLPDNGQPLSVDNLAAPAVATPRDRAWLEATTYQDRLGDGAIRYRCQATELRAASHPLPWWSPGQYLRDVCVNQIPWTYVVRGFLARLCNSVSWRLTRRKFPNVSGTLERTPVETLGLQPGEWVIVKSRAEIRATLDKDGKNRGLSFDGEMLPYCGKRYRVLRRVERIVEESTGRLLQPRIVSVILDGVFCRSLFRMPCPRCIYSYWREIWLRRDPHQDPAPARDELPLVNIAAPAQTVESR